MTTMNWMAERAEVLTALAVLTQSMETLERLIREIRSEVSGSGRAIQEIELRCASRAGLPVACDELEKRVQIVESWEPMIKGASWVAGIIGGLIVVMLWGLLTGQVSVGFLP